MALMGVQGLRVSEVASLSVQDVDLARNTVHVQGKGKRNRNLLLAREARARLEGWLAVFAAGGKIDAEPLFVRLHANGDCRAGGRMSTRAIRALVDGYLQRLGLKQRGFLPFVAPLLRHPRTRLRCAARIA
jgi:integrase/recombinase XerC